MQYASRTLITGCNDSEYNADTLLETSRINHITKYESKYPAKLTKWCLCYCGGGHV